MNLAKEINKRLDEILSIREEIKRMNEELDEDVQLKNLETGKPTTKKQALKVVEDMVNRIKDDLNRLTNNGRNAKGVFNNQYYINDIIQDKLIVENKLNKNFT